MKPRGIPVVLATTALLLSSCGDSQEDEEAEQQRRVERMTEALTELVPAKVTYVVTGKARFSPSFADITYATPTGTEQGTAMWERGAEDRRSGEFERGTFLYLSAQGGEDARRTTCRIEVDGQVVSENTSYEEFAVATCEGVAE